MLDIARLLQWLSSTANEKAEPQSFQADRRRFQRLNLQKCRVFIDEAGPFSLLNLSYGGLRLNLDGYDKLSRLKTGQKLNCDIFLENILLNNQLVVRNIEGSLIGCSFSNLSITESRILKDFLKPRMLGFSLREIDAAKLKNNSPELKMRWFQGDDSTQIFLWQTLDGESVMQEFYFLDYFIGWKKSEEGIKTGLIKEFARKSFGRISPDSVAFFQIPSYRALKLGQTILNFSNLPDEAKELLIKKIAREENRLYHRYVIKNNEVFFVPEVKKHLQIPVLNLSLSGISILNNEELTITIGTAQNGCLHLGTKQISISFLPVYKETHFCGGNFVTDKDGKAIFSEFLAPRLLAQYFEKVPAPIETPFFVGPGAHASLYSGLHNTHILSLLNREGKMIAGRIAFMDNLIRFQNHNLTAHRCHEGIIFPGDWEIPPHILKSEDKPDNRTIAFCRELLTSSQLPEELRNAWLEALEQTDRC